MTPYAWWAGYDEERYTVGPCASREEAIDEALSACAYNEIDPEPPEHPDWRVSIYVCEAAQHTVDEITIDGDRILENLYDHYSDWLDSESTDDDGLFTVTLDDVKDLTARLTAALHAWAVDKKLNAFMFAAVRNREVVVLPHPDNEPKEK